MAVEFHFHVNCHPERAVLDVEFQGTLGKEEVDVQQESFVKSCVETTKADSENGRGDTELAFFKVDLYRNLPSVRANWDG